MVEGERQPGSGAYQQRREPSVTAGKERKSDGLMNLTTIDMFRARSYLPGAILHIVARREERNWTTMPGFRKPIGNKIEKLFFFCFENDIFLCQSSGDAGTKLNIRKKLRRESM